MAPGSVLGISAGTAHSVAQQTLVITPRGRAGSGATGSPWGQLHKVTHAALWHWGLEKGQGDAALEKA